MSADDILRLHYQERQFLGARDFEDEQAYLIESRHRNNAGQRTWGILSGLEIKENSSGVWIVTAGAMIDAYGREVFVFEDTPLDLPEIGGKLANHATPISLKVWLSYATEETSPAAAGYLTCQDTNINTRTRETFRLIYQDNPVPFDAQSPDDSTRWPVATQDLPDDPKEAAWPVLLGTITWDGAPPKITAVDPTGRRYSGLRGAEVLSQTTQFDVHPARVRLNVDGAEKAVLTTWKAASNTNLAATTELYLRTNGDNGGAGIFVDKDNVDLGQKLSVTGTATLSDTVGNGSGKLILEVDTSNLATLTRRNGSPNNHDLAIRTNEGIGGNSILIDRDNLAIDNVTVTNAAVLKKGLDSWGPIILKQTAGGDDSDPMVISRFPDGNTNKNDLRIQIGDDLDGNDRLVVGPVYWNGQQFQEQFIVDNLGNVTAKGNANIGGNATINGNENVTGTLSTGGDINGRNVVADGAKLDTISSNAKEIVVLTGNALDGADIPLPSGFNDSDCHWIVSIIPPLSTTPRPPLEFHKGPDIRTVSSHITVGLQTFHGSADYLMIGVR
jgi:hypothetical protein